MKNFAQPQNDNTASMHIAFNFCKCAIMVANALLNVRKMSCLVYLKKKNMENIKQSFISE